MNKYEENANSLCIVNEKIKNEYFVKGEIIQKIFNAVRKNFILNDSLFSNYASDVMIIINCSMDMVDIITAKIKEFYDENNADFYDIYLTTYEKTINEKINESLLRKEIEIINPNKILYLGFDFYYQSYALSKDDLDLFISGVDEINIIKALEYERVNKKFILLLKYAIAKK